MLSPIKRSSVRGSIPPMPLIVHATTLFFRRGRGSRWRRCWSLCRTTGSGLRRHTVDHRPVRKLPLFQLDRYTAIGGRLVGVGVVLLVFRPFKILLPVRV